jgi:hypothetical protein
MLPPSDHAAAPAGIRRKYWLLCIGMRTFGTTVRPACGVAPKIVRLSGECDLDIQCGRRTDRALGDPGTRTIHRKCQGLREIHHCPCVPCRGNEGTGLRLLDLQRLLA